MIQVYKIKGGTENKAYEMTQSDGRFQTNKRCGPSQYSGITLKKKKKNAFFICKNYFLFNMLRKSQRKPNQVRHE